MASNSNGEKELYLPMSSARYFKTGREFEDHTRHSNFDFGEDR